jgi:phosphate-selective porin O/P
MSTVVKLKRKALIRSFLVSFPFLVLTSMGFSQTAANENLDIAGYDTTSYNALFIQSKDGLFKLNIGMYTQMRYNMNWRADAPDSIAFTRGYNLARTRIFFEGDLTDRFYYHFRANINASGNVELFVAYLQWNFAENWHVRIGKQFMILSREDWMFPSDIASLEFSANDFTFGIWTSLGFQIHNAPNNNIRYWLGLSNGVYGGRKKFPDPKDSDLLLTGRLEWNVNGIDWGNWDDLVSSKDSDFGMLIGVGAGQLFRYDAEALKTDAERGSQINVDFSLNGKGVQFFAQASITLRSFEDGVSNNFNQSGVYSTLGYWVNEKIFPYIRYDLVAAGTTPGNLEDYSSPGIGISVYPFQWTNKIRFTAEYNYLDATLNNTIVQPDGQLGLVESDFGSQQSFRAQFQFGF